LHTCSGVLSELQNKYTVLVEHQWLLRG